jgi:hypothetical protein
MVALNTVSFISTHADSYPPVCNGDGSWTLKFPIGGETCVGKTCTSVDLHQTVTIPVGYVGFISPSTNATIGASAGGVVNSQIIPGLGTPVALKLQVLNLGAAGAGDFSPAPNGNAAELIVIKQDEFKVDDTTGTW